jgi:hypothetical protein
MPWNDWYHLMSHTYGTWLPGDPKGFRTRHHREHIEGDYKNPPPAGRDAGRWEQSKKLMKRDPIYLDVAQRQRAVLEFVKSFAKQGIELKAIAIDRIHIHGLTRVVDHNPRHHMGVAKRECSHYMKVAGLAPVRGLWAVRCECVPIEHRQHFENVDNYILDHEEQGAAIWPARVIDRKYSINDMADFNPEDLLLE